MDARQRVALALDHKEPDRVPIDYWATSTVNARLRDHFGFDTQEQLLSHLDVDFRYIDGPKYIGPEPKVHEDGSIEDHWGVPRVRVGLGSGGYESVYREVLNFPLQHAQSIDEVRDYPKWPSPDWFDYDCVANQVAEAQRTGKVVVFMGDRMNRCASSSRPCTCAASTRSWSTSRWRPTLPITSSGASPTSTWNTSGARSKRPAAASTSS